LDAERISFKERSIISPITTAAPYWGKPLVVITDEKLEETTPEEIILNNIENLF